MSVLHTNAFKGKTFEGESRENSDDARGQYEQKYERLKREFGQEPPQNDSDDPDAWRRDPELQPDAQARGNGAEPGGKAWKGEAKGPSPKLKLYNLAKLLEEPAPPRKWVIEGLIPDEEVSSLGGDGGLGKSTLMLQIGCACATGRDWLGFALKRRCKVLYLSCEDDQDEVHFRAEQINKAEAIPLSLENFDAIEPEDETFLATPEPRTGRLASTPLFLWLEKYIEQNGISLLLLDSIADVFGGDELNRIQVRSFLQLLRTRIARKLKCPVLFLAHPSVSGMRDGRGYSGSTHWNNGVRSRMYLESVKNKDGEDVDTDFRTLKLMKTNRAKAGLEIGLRWKDGRFIREDEKSAVSVVQGIGDEDLFLDLLDLYNSNNDPVHLSPGKKYAPAEFVKHETARKAGITKERLERAMQRLLDNKRIINQPTGPESRRRWNLVRAQSEIEVPF